MCGIIAYVGRQQALPILINGLKRLEYRGYDSAGVAVMNPNLTIYKKKGKVINLEEHALNNKIDSTIGMGHTRWATHGEPCDRNSHPHLSNKKDLAIIHNGIIENYATLKQELLSKGHVFESDTDSEVLIHFIEDIQENLGCALEEAVRIALTRVTGAYAIVVMSQKNPDMLIAARKSSPLIVGVGKDEFFLASDATPIIQYTKQVVYLKDYEVAVIKNGKLTITDLQNNIHDAYIKELDIELAAIEKGNFEHYMLKEIFEQPKTILDCLRGRLLAEEGKVRLGGLREYIDQLCNAKRIIIIACGTSLNAGMVARYLFQEICRIPVEVEYASEFRYGSPVVRDGDVVIAISQSGETADTLVAIEKAKEMGAIILGICNVVGSSIPRASHAGVYTHAGAEIGVASTKAFTAQLTVLYLIALQVAKEKGTLDNDRFRLLLNELDKIPAKVQTILDNSYLTQSLASLYLDAQNMIYLGRGYNFPIALEGALKIKEISYIHAEGYPAAEMKHGPIALIDEEMPVVFIATKDHTYEKIVSNIQEVKARKGKVIAIVTEGDEMVKSLADHVFEIPETDEILTPLLSVIPLQLFAYYTGVLRGCNVDQPRNLAKSVTVE
ncbi:glutamine--fructose-6-phosphate transaminase (isomerizing) [Solitalea sp. MAHUQ-68]|uniref:Glutamine--fructose-6-phosphate aminotransferase [isomerizing] n=1 Tax=Solitalea agri TaxID=2953739 RepID=A0A9X2JBE3_9SPHI|nr:glutamine--fructose-6-phosphate transaminase (isomerizing) [Solitalea agri]MCO4291324.1 glutamine--fructose-6-phosphate transaminase (isomerizing) [Solitalea agri]